MRQPATFSPPAVSARLRALKLQDRTWSQRRLSIETGIPETVVSEMLNGKLAPSPEHLDRIARALRVSIAEITTGGAS